MKFWLVYIMIGAGAALAAAESIADGECEAKPVRCAAAFSIIIFGWPADVGYEFGKGRLL